MQTLASVYAESANSPSLKPVMESREVAVMEEVVQALIEGMQRSRGGCIVFDTDRFHGN